MFNMFKCSESVGFSVFVQKVAYDDSMMPVGPS